MANSFFRFKQFTVHHDRCGMKVTTDACLFGAWVAATIAGEQLAYSKESLSGQPNFLDIGAGTGLLSLMVAQRTEALIDAIELERSAAEQAGENIAASGWSNRIEVINQDLLQWKPDKKFDVIFSNPPFYQNELKSANRARNKAHHDDGLLLPDLLQFVQTYLTESGSFFLLLPAKRESNLDVLLRESRLSIHRKILVQQTTKHAPFRIMVQGKRMAGEITTIETISIKDENGCYTPAFTALLKDYYLHL
jgi:tRNA1Val (adenine37-N6)-methyltransferase